MTDSYKTAIGRSQKRFSKKGTVRKSRDAVVDDSRAVEAAARTKLLRDSYKSIENRAQKERNARKYQSKAEIEQRVRAQMQLGTVAKGQFKKTVDRRFKATQGRKTKFESALRGRVVTEKNAALTRMQATTRTQLGVRDVSALVQFMISTEQRAVVLSFTTGGDVVADAAKAMQKYMHGSRVQVTGVTELS